MTRRQALGLIIMACLIAGGRAIRQHLLLAGNGQWRDPLWLDSLLPPTPTEEDEVSSPLVLTGPVDINHCAQETLLALPGIGPVLAERLLAARRDGVHFACPEDLQKIKGIGPKLAARLQDRVLWPESGPLKPPPPTASTSADSNPG